MTREPESTAGMDSPPDARRDTLGFEVVVRFYPGAESEAYEFARELRMPEQATSIRLLRIVAPLGEERIQEMSRG